MPSFPTTHRRTLLALLALLLAAQLHAQTPPDLRQLLNQYRQTADRERQLDLGYAALDRYAYVAQKSAIDPPDRETLSEVKRLVLFDAFGQDRHEALLAGSGSTGNWALRRNMRNDYTEGQIPRLKHENYYLEGMSDLDFAVMGGSASAFVDELYRVFARGRGQSQLTREELQKLEISFIADEQIRDVSRGGDGLKFWKQMMDLSRSSYHPEKYLTKGGKGLYCIEHLQIRGAAVERLTPMEFSAWTTAAGQTIPPFTAQYLYGGCCDMDYFLRHALGRTEQEPMKTVLQATKYLLRQAWMLQQSHDNVDKLPDGMSIDPRRVEQFRQRAALLRVVCDDAIDAEVWRDSLPAFTKAAVEEAAQTCIGSHNLICDMGWDLVWKAERGKLTEAQALVLTEIAYDLRTVHEQRYRDGRPPWYDTVIETDTVALLAAIDEARPKVNVVLAQTGLLAPEDPELAEVEIGPIAPPPIATIELDPPVMTPPTARPGEKVTFATSGRIAGVLDPAQSGPPPLSAEQLRAMQELSRWAWRATHLRMQIQYLILSDQENSMLREPEDRVYVSPYELKELGEQLNECEDSVASWAETLGLKPPETAAGRYRPNLRPVATLASVDDYLQALKDTCEQGTAALDDLCAKGEELSAMADKVAKDPKSRGLPIAAEIAAARAQLDRMLAEAAPRVARTKQLLAEAEKYAGWAVDVKQAFTGDVAFLTSKAGELEGYLSDLAQEAQSAAEDAQKLQNALSDGIGLFRRCAVTVPEGDRFGLRKDLVSQVRAWDKDKNELMLRTIPDLQERARWLARGTFAAKSARVALQALSVIQDYRKTREELDRSLRLTGETKNAVMALKACGDIIAAGADYVPIPVLRQTIKDYAGLLSSAKDWSLGFAAMLEQQRQGHGFDVMPAPAAIKALIAAAPQRDPSLFHLDEGPFATLNDLQVITWATRPAEEEGEAWVIWAPDREDGFIHLSDKADSRYTFAQASLLAARFRRVYDRRITAEELKDLVTTGKSTKGLFLKDTIEAGKVTDQGKWILHVEAAKDYLAGVVARQQFSPDELARYRGMAEVAADRLAEGGFLVHDEDIRQIIGPVKLQPMFSGWWDTLFGWIDPLAAAWDWLSDGEKTRLQEAIARRVKQKEDLRRQARERFWADARQQNPAAGLTLADIALKIDHSLLWPGAEAKQTATLRPQGPQFAVQWEATLPPDIKGSPGYVCRAQIATAPSVWDERELPMSAPSGDWVIMRTANKTIRVGRTADLQRKWVCSEVLWAGLSEDPIQVARLEGTDTYPSLEEALDGIVAAADPGGPMGTPQIFWRWFAQNNPKRVAVARVRGEDYILHAYPDKVTLATETSGVQFGRVWYFPEDEERWLLQRGIKPYIPLSKPYLLHLSGQGTTGGYVKLDTWVLFPQPPNAAGKINIPDPYWLGSVYITDVDQTIGPFEDSHSVSLALRALAGKGGQPLQVTVPGTGLTIGPESAPEPSVQYPPVEALGLLAKAMVETGPVRLAQEEGKLKFTSFPPGYVNELLYADNAYGPEDYQKRVSGYFAGLAAGSDEGQKALMAPVRIVPLISTGGSQPAVALVARGKDWASEGRVFDGWLSQGGESMPAEEWIAANGTAQEAMAADIDPPVRMAVRGPVLPVFGSGSGQAGWSADGRALSAPGVRLSRSPGVGETRYYLAAPGPGTLTLQATGSGVAQVLVRVGEGRLVDYDGIRCSRGDALRMDIALNSAGALVGSNQRIEGKLYDLQDAMRNEEVLLAESGSFAHAGGGNFNTAELQVTINKPGLLKVAVTTPGPFEFGQSGASCRCDRIERLEGGQRQGVQFSHAGGDWKASPVVTVTSARLEQPGTYVLRIVQAMSLSPTWGDVMSAPAHDYEVKATLENLQ